jgi:hypothetical protein
MCYYEDKGREGVMFHTTSAALVVAALAAFGGSQTATPGSPATSTTSTPAPAAKPADTKGKPLVLSGCIAHPDGDKFTLNDDKHGLFQLTGKPLDIYIGKRVEINGTSTTSSGLHITTGLYPTPNLAAQAGADPVGAFTASMPGGGSRGTGTTSPDSAPMYTVTSVKSVKGVCK